MKRDRVVLDTNVLTSGLLSTTSTPGRADVVVSGDGDLLDLNPFRGIAILTPAAYVDRQTPNGT